MPLLQGQIPEQRFELLGKRIAQILAEELGWQQQYASPPNSGEWPSEVWVERVTPPDKTELPLINVCLDTGSYSNKNAKSADGSYRYYIEVYSSSAGTEEDDGDALAAIKLLRIMGMCRAILENPVYRTLGYAAPSLKRVYVESFKKSANNKLADALNTVYGEIAFVVEAPESVELIQPVLIGQAGTTVRLGDTDKGYFYQYVNE